MDTSKNFLDPANTNATDFDGTYWPCINGMEEGQLRDKTVIYPNPSNGNFTIEALEKLDDLYVIVYDAVGKKITEMDMSGLYVSSFDLSTEANGMYYVQLRTGATSITKKVLVAK